MSDQHIHSQVKDYLAQMNPAQPIRPNDPRLARFASSLPLLSPRQVRALTKAQQQQILEKVVTVSSGQLLQEAGRVCPEVRDLASISQEEVASRLHLYSTKLVLTERPTCESSQESEGEWREEGEAGFFGEVGLDMRLIEEEVQEEHIMRNIFEEVDHHPCWSTHEYFSLS